ncbi:MAG: class I tRNA ligase family protein, partial [Holophagaceae bacterium]
MFRALRNVNWCEALGTVLANEQVVDGKDERTGHPVVQKPMEQYFFAITKYADELIEGLESLDWPENIKAMQRHWIGRSAGARLSFGLTSGARISVFTTRIDTLFGVSFLALSTEHPVIQEAAQSDPDLASFCQTIGKQSREERLTSDVKLGHRTRLQARHPMTGDLIPIFAANYVLMDYGTGAVMGVPGHDERDEAFALKYQLPIVTVIEAPTRWEPGVLIHSGDFSGMTSEAASHALVKALAQTADAEWMLTFKLKDWGLSRQRYWGTPIPTVHCPQCGVVPETEDRLPVLLPEDIQFSGRGASPLTTSTTFLRVACPDCGTEARRETDTMDTFVDSSWYWLRYLDSKNTTQAFHPDEAKAWTPVDLYIGGAEHATMHLIYARYFHKVLRDLGMA